MDIREKIRSLYAITRELEEAFPGRRFTPDGHTIGSIGEVIAEEAYGLTLLKNSAETHDALTADGKLVQIKATQVDRVALSSEPDYLIVMKLDWNGEWEEIYNGVGNRAWKNAGKPAKTGQKQITLTRLRRLMKEVSPEERIKRAEADKAPGEIMIREITPSHSQIGELIRLSQAWAEEDITRGLVPNEESDIADKRVFTAEEGGAIIGYVFAKEGVSKNYRSVIPDGEKYFGIEEIYVAPGRRSEGIGRALMDFVRETARRDGYKYAFLVTSTKDSEKILDFYINKCGMTFYCASLVERL